MTTTGRPGDASPPAEADGPWPFVDDIFPAAFLVAVARTVHDGAPALQVVHLDAGWGFSDGVTEPTEENLVVVHVGHLLEADPTLQALATLRSGWQADRESSREPWVYSRHQEPHRTGLIDRIWYVIDALRFGDEVAMRRLYQRYQAK